MLGGLKVGEKSEAKDANTDGDVQMGDAQPNEARSNSDLGSGEDMELDMGNTQPSQTGNDMDADMYKLTHDLKDWSADAEIEG